MVNTIWTIGWGTLIFTLARHGQEITSQTGWWVPLAMIVIVWIMLIPAELTEKLEYKPRFRKVISGECESVDCGRPSVLDGIDYESKTILHRRGDSGESTY